MAALALGGSDASRPQLRLRRQLYPEAENLKRLLFVSRQGPHNSEALFLISAGPARFGGAAWYEQGRLSRLPCSTSTAQLREHSLPRLHPAIYTVNLRVAYVQVHS